MTSLINNHLCLPAGKMLEQMWSLLILKYSHFVRRIIYLIWGKWELYMVFNQTGAIQY